MSFLFGTPNPLVCNVKVNDTTQTYESPNKVSSWIAIVLVIIATGLFFGTNFMLYGGILYVISIILTILSTTVLKEVQPVCISNPLLK